MPSFRKNLRRSLLLLLLLAAAASAKAQFGVYLMGSGGHLSGTNVGFNTASGQNGSFTAWGGTLGLYDDFIKAGPVRLGTDIRGFIQSSSNGNSSGSGPYTANATSNQLRAALFGLRLSAGAPLVPVRPYIQAEIGAGSTNYGYANSRTGGFAYQVQAGGDFTVVPHVDIRAEYGAGQLRALFNGNNSQAMQEFGAGVVLRF